MAGRALRLPAVDELILLRPGHRGSQRGEVSRLTRKGEHSVQSAPPYHVGQFENGDRMVTFFRLSA